MQLDQLEILEEKINTAIQVINKLQAENNELKKYNMELIKRVQEHETTIQKLHEEYQILKDQQNNTNFNNEKEEEIKHKVEGILAKLDTLQQISTF